MVVCGWLAGTVFRWAIVVRQLGGKLLGKGVQLAKLGVQRVTLPGHCDLIADAPEADGWVVIVLRNQLPQLLLGVGANLANEFGIPPVFGFGDGPASIRAVLMAGDTVQRITPQCS